MGLLVRSCVSFGFRRCGTLNSCAKPHIVPKELQPFAEQVLAVADSIPACSQTVHDRKGDEEQDEQADGDPDLHEQEIGSSLDLVWDTCTQIDSQGEGDHHSRDHAPSAILVGEMGLVFLGHHVASRTNICAQPGE